MICSHVTVSPTVQVSTWRMRSQIEVGFICHAVSFQLIADVRYSDTFCLICAFVNLTFVKMSWHVVVYNVIYKFTHTQSIVLLSWLLSWRHPCSGYLHVLYLRHQCKVSTVTCVITCSTSQFIRHLLRWRHRQRVECLRLQGKRYIHQLPARLSSVLQSCEHLHSRHSHRGWSQRLQCAASLSRWCTHAGTLR